MHFKMPSPKRQPICHSLNVLLGHPGWRLFEAVYFIFHPYFRVVMGHLYLWLINTQLEQLERLRSEDTPRRLMITHTIESYWIPSQKKTKSKLQI